MNWIESFFLSLCVFYSYWHIKSIFSLNYTNDSSGTTWAQEPPDPCWCPASGSLDDEDGVEIHGDVTDGNREDRFGLQLPWYPGCFALGSALRSPSVNKTGFIWIRIHLLVALFASIAHSYRREKIYDKIKLSRATQMRMGSLLCLVPLRVQSRYCLSEVFLTTIISIQIHIVIQRQY